MAQKRNVRLLDAVTHAEQRQLTGIPGDYTSILFSPDGKWLVSMGHPETTAKSSQLWDTANGKEIRKWTVTRTGRMAFCPTVER